MTLFLIMGNQLFPTKYISKLRFDQIYMSEDEGLCTQPKQHKLKILFFLSSMRSHRDILIKEKYKVNYLDINVDFSIPYIQKLIRFIEKNNVKKLLFFEIEDKSFEKKLMKSLKTIGVSYVSIQSPMFLTPRDHFKGELNNMKKPKMSIFYVQQRKKLGLLVDNDKPLGGKWSFDTDNRKKLPKKITIPKIKSPVLTKNTRDLLNFVASHFKKHPGDITEHWLPTTRVQSLKWLDCFIEDRLKFFGDYEDAVDTRSPTLFHSAISPLLNIGLLTPKDVIDKVKKKKNIPINSLEGFIRQIIGWREFIRGIYQNYDQKLSTTNYFNHKRKMGKTWYTAKTGLEPLDFSINRTIKLSWSSHIERLMIQANIMNLCEINPKEIYNWFLEMYSDSSEWVMSPNVYGMGIFSDGGIFATKPYICGSNYFLKMMSFKKGPWCDILDGLYWRFIKNNEDFFKSNPRLSMMVVMLKKIKSERKKIIFKKAEEFINYNTIKT